jgi:hypothetical protein
MTHTETVRRRKRGDGVTEREREMDTKREKKRRKRRENKRTSKLDNIYIYINKENKMERRNENSFEVSRRKIKVKAII